MGLKGIILWVSWLRTLAAFHLFGRFRNYSPEQIAYFKKYFKPKNQRDQSLADKIINYNLSRK